MYLPLDPFLFELERENFPVLDGFAVQEDRTLPETFLLEELVRSSEVGPAHVLHLRSVS
jgi:hypothetical protein